MRIAYVAKHGSGGNDDEGAVAHALRELGHEVTLYTEDATFIAPADFCLFHKWDNFGVVQHLDMPRVFWYFDLVEYPDTILERRNMNRRHWMGRVMPHILCGFCTDGDWATKHDKLYHLPQGADERVMGIQLGKSNSLLITASGNGGQGRSSFLNDMRTKYKNITIKERGLHGPSLRAAVGQAAAVIAPDHPCTDLYWSNRVYLTLGFGGLLLHPFTVGLARDLRHGEHLMYYGSRNDLHSKLEWLLSRTEEERTLMRLAAFQAIRKEHLYKHRCAKLISIVQERLEWKTS